MGQFYDGTRLLSMMDINGNKPEIYMCTSNRSAGKTTWFNRYAVKKFIDKREKFGLLYRYNYELDNVADKFFKDINVLYFQNYTMRSERRANGIYHELFLTSPDTDEKGINCGYALSLNSADQIKKNSHLFSDIVRLIFDEFQSETDHYCPDELTKFISVHTSVARGQGKQVRYVPVYMISNPVSLINPYYVEMEIASRLRYDTKFLRGEGFVLEQGFVDSASKAQKESGFNAAFKRNKYVAYSSQNVYLNDSYNFIEKPTGISKYLGTFRYNDKDYAIREYTDSGIMYCDDRPDSTYRYKISVTTADHNVNYIMLRNNDIFVQNMRWYFERGCFRFKDLRCKDALLKLICY